MKNRYEIVNKSTGLPGSAPILSNANRRMDRFTIASVQVKPANINTTAVIPAIFPLLFGVHLKICWP